MKNIVIFGAPGAGKGTQSALLIAEYHLAHISTGDVLRGHITAQTPIGLIAEKYINSGQLVPDRLILAMLKDFLSTLPADQAGVIFDGFPRTLDQAAALDELLAERGETVTCVIGLEVAEEELIERILLRGKTSGRSDDNRETVKQRLATYHKCTLPLKDYYEAQGKYLVIDGTGTVDDVFARVKAAMG